MNLNYQKHRDSIALKRKQKGFSMIETIFVAIIVAFALIGLYQLFKDSGDDQKATESQKSVMALAGNINRLYSGVNNYDTITTGSVAASGLVPSSLSIGGTAPNQTITHAWGGLVSVNPATNAGATGGTGRQFFAVDIAGVEREGCAKFASGLAGSASALFVQSTALAATAPTGAAIIKPFQGVVNPAALAAACGSGNVLNVRAVYR